MKKIISFIALVMAIIIIPMGVDAATIVPKCEKSCPTEGGKCTSTCKINVEGNTAEINSFIINPPSGVILTQKNNLANKIVKNLLYFIHFFIFLSYTID